MIKLKITHCIKRYLIKLWPNELPKSCLAENLLGYALILVVLSAPQTQPKQDVCTLTTPTQ
jgi:hypothetical protein